MPGWVAVALAPLDAALAEVGREPATLLRTLLLSVDLPGPRRHPPLTAYGIDRTAEAAAGEVLTGDPAAIAGTLRAYAEAGIGHVVVHLDPDTVEGIEAFAPVLALLDDPRGDAARPGRSRAARPRGLGSGRDDAGVPDGRRPLVGASRRS